MKEREAMSEQIEAYLGGTLSAKAQRAFEEKLQVDEALNREVQLHQELAEAVQEEKVFQLEDMLEEVGQAYEPKKTPVVWFKSFRNIAAGLLLFILAGFAIFYSQTSPSNSILFAETYTPYPMYLVDRSDTTVEWKNQVTQAYEKKDFTEALKTLEQVPATDSLYSVVQFYQGICQLSLNKPMEAAFFFQQVLAQGNSAFVSPAEWYLALSYLKLNDVGNAQLLLQNIIDRNSDYALEAKKLLEQL